MTMIAVDAVDRVRPLLRLRAAGMMTMTIAEAVAVRAHPPHHADAAMMTIADKVVGSATAAATQRQHAGAGKTVTDRTVRQASVNY